ncbi:MAG: DoxX family protein [Desulfuromonadales bacterium]|jgi:putative oxidoreductase
MINALIKTDNDSAALVLRVLLGIVMFPHGAQKVLGWFGGYGLSGSLHYFTDTMGIPLAFAALAIAAEFLGSLGLLTGFLTRVAAFGLGVEMVVAALMVHIKNGFFMNWSGHQAGEGIEYHILVVAIAFALVIRGGGRWSIDRLLTRNTREKNPGGE